MQKKSSVHGVFNISWQLNGIWESVCVYVGVFSTKKDKRTFCQAVISVWSNAGDTARVFVSVGKCFSPI